MLRFVSTNDVLWDFDADIGQVIAIIGSIMVIAIPPGQRKGLPLPINPIQLEFLAHEGEQIKRPSRPTTPDSQMSKPDAVQGLVGMSQALSLTPGGLPGYLRAPSPGPSPSRSEVDAAFATYTTLSPDLSPSNGTANLGIDEAIASNTEIEPAATNQANSADANTVLDAALPQAGVQDILAVLSAQTGEAFTQPKVPEAIKPSTGCFHCEVPTLQQLEDKILKIDGRIEKAQTASVWKFLRAYRNNQDIGSLFDIREDYYVRNDPRIVKMPKNTSGKTSGKAGGSAPVQDEADDFDYVAFLGPDPRASVQGKTDESNSEAVMETEEDDAKDPPDSDGDFELPKARARKPAKGKGISKPQKKIPIGRAKKSRSLRLEVEEMDEEAVESADEEDVFEEEDSDEDFGVTKPKAKKMSKAKKGGSARGSDPCSICGKTYTTHGSLTRHRKDAGH